MAGGGRQEDRALVPKRAPVHGGQADTEKKKKEAAPPDWEVAGFRSRELTSEACPGHREKSRSSHPRPES